VRLPSPLRRLVRPDEQLARVERELRALRREARADRRLMLRTQAALDALLRRAYLDPETLGYPARLTAQRFGVLSQNGEDGILLALLAEAGPGPASFAEVGCGTNGGNSGFLARELGWSGIMIDGSASNLDEIRLLFNAARVQAVHAFVTRENIDELLRGNGLEGELGLLSIDLDGNDLWVWEAISVVAPRIVVVEYNALFGPSRAVAVPYAADHVYEPESAYYGASLAALAALGRRKGYRLVTAEPRGTNAFFLRDGVAPEIPATTPEEAFATLLAPSQLYADPIGAARAAKLRAREAELDALVRERGLPLVEIT
jgi:hypothetical protein